ncbi:MAG: hypothetical protein V2A73_06800 [Pseudomonadota bacterium]
MTEFTLITFASALATALILMALAITAVVILSVWPVYVAGVATVGVPWLAVWLWRRRRKATQ